MTAIQELVARRIERQAQAVAAHRARPERTYNLDAWRAWARALRKQEARATCRR